MSTILLRHYSQLVNRAYIIACIPRQTHTHGEDYDGEDNTGSSFDVPVHMLIATITTMMLHLTVIVTSLAFSRLFSDITCYK